MNKNGFPGKNRILNGVLCVALGGAAVVGANGCANNGSTAANRVTGPQLVAAQDKVHAAIVAGQPIAYEAGIEACQTPKVNIAIESPIEAKTDDGKQLVGYATVDPSAPNGFSVELFDPKDPGAPVRDPGADKCELITDGANTEAPGTQHLAVLHVGPNVGGGYYTQQGSYMIGTDPKTGETIDRTADGEPLPIGLYFQPKG